MADTTEIRIPDLGDFSDVDVIEVLVSPGDKIEEEDGLIVLETDKASMDVPSTAAGTVKEVKVSVGDTVNEGDVIVIMEAASDGGEDAAGDGREVEDREDARKERGQQTPEEGADEKEKSARRDDAMPAGESGEDAGPAAGREEEDDDGGGKRTVTVPDLGDFEEVDVIEVHVASGDEIQTEDPVITLETDKATMDVPSPDSGEVLEVLTQTGDKVSTGDEILILRVSSGDAETAAKRPSGERKAGEESEEKEETEETEEKAERGEAAAEAAESKPEGEPQAEAGRQAASASAQHEDTATPAAIDEAGFSKAHASPSVRKLARELGVDLVQVKGSGKKGRILADDVKAWVKKRLTKDGEKDAGAVLPGLPEVDFDKFGETELEPLGRIRKISARRLQAAWVNLPHVTQHDVADITELEKRRQELKGAAAEKGIRLTPLAFIVKACVQALKEFPRFNASLHPDGERLVMKCYFHIGFAADTPQGLVVPVIRDADRKDVYELATELAELSEAARDGKLGAEKMQGGSFTVSSLGGIGGTAFTPIINAPEVAILGVSRSVTQPVWDGEQFRPRLMLPLSLSYDHRVIDGADAVRFTTWLGEALGDVSSLLEAIP